MNHIYFNLRRLLKVTPENKNDLKMLLTGIKMVAENEANRIDIDTENIPSTSVCHNYENGIVSIDNPYFTIMLHSPDAGALAYYALAAIEEENSNEVMEEVINMTAKKAMSVSRVTSKEINDTVSRKEEELKNRLKIFYFTSRTVKI